MVSLSIPVGAESWSVWFLHSLVGFTLLYLSYFSLLGPFFCGQGLLSLASYFLKLFVEVNLERGLIYLVIVILLISFLPAKIACVL